MLKDAHGALLMYVPPDNQPPQHRVQVSSRQRLFSWHMLHQPAEIHWAHTLSLMMSIVLQSRMSYNREVWHVWTWSTENRKQERRKAGEEGKGRNSLGQQALCGSALTSMLFPGPLPGFISINECFPNDGKHPFFSSQKM